MAGQLPLPFEIPADQSFNNYYAGNNQAALESLQKCANGYGEEFILLCGSSGLGKTHLLQACCQLAREKQRQAAYLRSQVIQSHGPECLQNLHTLDLVCIDDLDIIAENAELEQAFFHCFNRIRDNGKQLIITTRTAAAHSKIALPDLKTRLASGLTIKLHPPSDEDKLETLRLGAQQLGFELTPQVGHYILTHYPRDVASLWQALKQLDQATLSAKRKLTIPFIKQHMESVEKLPD